MKYVLLIHQGDTPTPNHPDEWARLSQEEQNQVFADYQAINQTPGVTPGLGLAEPQTATTVRVDNGQTLTTDGPSTSSAVRTAVANPSASATSTEVSPGNIVARPAPSRLGANRL